MITCTSLAHPAMIAKIRLGMRLAALGKGDQMNGYGTRVYIPNAKGHNVIRCTWLADKKEFVFYISGSSQVANETIKAAFKLAQSGA